jgi:hypothetical protein
MRRFRTAAAAVSAVAVVGAAATGAFGQNATSAASCPIPKGTESVKLDPATFSTTIDNPWWPMKPGNTWRFRETDPTGAVTTVVVTVTSKTKVVANGITARVVHDVATEDGKPVEVTDDYYAQDRCGNVWYLGEATAAYENGKVVSRHGSFEAGVDGAEGGIAVPARPRVGLAYRQEHYPGQAEDRARVFSLTEQVEVPYGHFRVGKVLMTREQNPLEPKMLEYKYLVRGVGPVLAIGVSGSRDREELIRFTRG